MLVSVARRLKPNSQVKKPEGHQTKRKTKGTVRTRMFVQFQAKLVATGSEEMMVNPKIMVNPKKSLFSS